MRALRLRWDVESELSFPFKAGLTGLQSSSSLLSVHCPERLIQMFLNTCYATLCRASSNDLFVSYHRLRSSPVQVTSESPYPPPSQEPVLQLSDSDKTNRSSARYICKIIDKTRPGFAVLWMHERMISLNEKAVGCACVCVYACVCSGSRDSVVNGGGVRRSGS